jgi:hypothetical protein
MPPARMFLQAGLAVFLASCELSHHAARLHDFGIDSCADVQDDSLASDATFIHEVRSCDGLRWGVGARKLTPCVLACARHSLTATA